MAFTCRLRPEIQAAAQVEAERMGISLMAFMSVAVRAYLDRPVTASFAPLLSVADVAPLSLPQVTFAPPKKPRAPCPCGSGQQWRHCHGKGV